MLLGMMVWQGLQYLGRVKKPPLVELSVFAFISFVWLAVAIVAVTRSGVYQGANLLAVQGCAWITFALSSFSTLVASWDRIRKVQRQPDGENPETSAKEAEHDTSPTSNIDTTETPTTATSDSLQRTPSNDGRSPPIQAAEEISDLGESTSSENPNVESAVQDKEPVPAPIADTEPSSLQGPASTPKDVATQNPDVEHSRTAPL